jgi:hypothetical protein
MKPTRAQYFFASSWPLRIWFGGISLTTAGWIAWKCATFLDPLADWRDFAKFALYTGVGMLLGFFLAVFPGWFVLGPLYYDRELKNGGPFQVGDTVMILTGPHRGRIARVYSTWQGDNVRVEIGEEAARGFADIFSPLQLMRAPARSEEPSPKTS